MKTCSRCELPKPISSFRKDKGCKSGRRNLCKACHSKAQRMWYATTREFRRLVAAEYRASHREQLRQAERDRVGRMSKAEYEVIRKRARDWGRQHPERVAERVRSFKATPGGRLAVKEYNSRRRALKRVSGVLPEKVPASIMLAIFEGYGNACFYCGKGGIKLTLDHFVALNMGGVHAPGNLVPCCSRCNSSKQDSAPLEWMLREGIEPRLPSNFWAWPDE